ncbi:hypothetical protein KUV57_22650 [Epibacterium sp. DP7N7-1]|nr:hypothetical protein [Epibacterium sp. DP7N7-1]
MSDDAPKTFTQVFSPSDYGFKKFEWVKKPTHVPEPRTQTLYGIEVEDADGNPMPYFAHPKPYKDSLN